MGKEKNWQMLRVSMAPATAATPMLVSMSVLVSILARSLVNQVLQGREANNKHNSLSHELGL